MVKYLGELVEEEAQPFLEHRQPHRHVGDIETHQVVAAREGFLVTRAFQLLGTLPS